MVNFGPLAAKIVSLVWGTPANFNGFCVLAALLHGTLVVGVSQTLRRWTEGATYIPQGGHHVGHWPTFLVSFVFQSNQVTCIHNHALNVRWVLNTKNVHNFINCPPPVGVRCEVLQWTFACLFTRMFRTPHLQTSFFLHVICGPCSVLLTTMQYSIILPVLGMMSCLPTIC